MTTSHAFGDDCLGDLDAVGIADRIARREISVAEAVEAAIARVERVDPHVHALAVEAFDRALAAAGTGGRPGPFAGVPSLIKDNVDVAGLPTRYGSAAFTAPRPARGDGPPAAQFLDQGFVVLGKTTMPEFGLAATTESAVCAATLNPWNLSRSAGGSSGGSGALVAAGAVPIAHGNDGGGSIRIPAAVSGLVGLKVSRGRLRDQPGANHLPVNIAAEGALARTVRDAAHHLAAMERSHRNPSLPAVGLVAGPTPRRLRIGVFTETVSGADVHREMVSAVRKAADLLADLGHDVVEIPSPGDRQFVEDFRLYWGFFAAALSANTLLLHPRTFDPRRRDPLTKAMARFGARNAHRWPAAFRRLRAMAATYDAAFDGIEVLLSPVLTHPVPRIGYLDPTLPFDEVFARTTDWVGFTPLHNVSGAPAIALPFGLMSENLPGSVHLAARRGAERTLLELAYEIEQAHPFPRLHAGDVSGELSRDRLSAPGADSAESRGAPRCQSGSPRARR